MKVICCSQQTLTAFKI
ncbi:hypothetical protein RDABS01_023580 [Bienertia sinuspersici]